MSAHEQSNHVKHEFINEAILAIRASAYWLKSEIGDSSLEILFDGFPSITLNMNVMLPDGNLLTAPKHSELLRDIYDFLCVQTYRNGKAGRTRSADADRRKIIRALHVIDYFLLNASELSLERYGFRGLVGSNIKKFFVDLASSSSIATSLYGWNKFMPDFIIKMLATHTKEELQTIVKKRLEFSLSSTVDDSHLFDGYSISDIRATLMIHGNYYRANWSKYEFRADLRSIEKEIYKNTLYGLHPSFQKPVPDELHLRPYDDFAREYEMASVRTISPEDICNEKVFQSYKSTFSGFEQLAKLGIGIPEKSIKDFQRYRLEDLIDLKALGRFASLPTELVILSLSKAIDHFYDNAEALGNLLVGTLAENVTGKRKMQRRLDNALAKYRSENLALYEQIRSWSLVRLRDGNELEAFERRSKKNFFRDFKNNMSLLEAVHVLYGAMQLIIGTLLAARQGELTDLPLACNDEHDAILYLLSRKTGFGTLRRLDGRPLPAVAQDVVIFIQNLHERLQSIGVAVPDRLFASPNIFGKFSIDVSSYNQCIDRFLDYTNSPINEDGQRYYIRQHQLRRAFALIFACSSGYSDSDALRWMLRQDDPAHLWNYLTNAMSGDMLKNTLSEAAAIMIRDGRTETSELADYLYKKFGVSAFELMDKPRFEKYVNYIDNMQDQQRVTIEMLFPVLNDTTLPRLGIIVWGDDDF